MPFLIYNSLSQKKEVFTPLQAPQVKMYCCGPTVYDLLHIGNFRGAVFFNFLRQWLEHKGYQVTYAYNFTDVDDKILNRAKKENKEMQEIASKYIAEFKKDFQALKLKKHEYNPKATEFLSDIIKLIKTLLQKDKAYIIDKDVFFSISHFSDYGKLSQRKKEELLSGARVAIDKRKKHPGDFALWKSCAEKEPGWDTPWGRGRPGWHIECTTMIFSLLGHNIDIHGGGTDLLFPHHENELAQAEAAKKGPFVKYWIHNNMFTFGGEKMAKSTGNISTMRSFLEEYNGEIFKYLTLSSHYRSKVEVSENKILHCFQALSRIYTFLKTADLLIDSVLHQTGQKFTSSELRRSPWGRNLQKPQDSDKTNIDNSHDKGNHKSLSQSIQLAQQNIEKALNDDLNTPIAMATLFTLIRQFNENNNSNSNKKELAIYARDIKNIIIKYGKIMSLFQEAPEPFLQEMDGIFLRKNKLNREIIDNLVAERGQARKNKNFKKADKIRDKLWDMNIEVKDSPQETVWETKKTNFLSSKNEEP